MWWKTLHRLRTDWKILREIIWIPHSNRNMQETSNDRYGQVISPKLASEIGLWQSKMGVLRGDIWIILISVVASPWRGISLICGDLMKDSQQMVGPNLRFFGLLAYSICSLMQCARQLNLYVQIVSSFVHHSSNQSTGTQSSVTLASRFQCGMCIISWWTSQLTMRWFSFIPVFVLSLASQPSLHPEMRQITPIMRSYWMFSVEKCDLIEVSHVSRRISHLFRNIQETFHLRHTWIISPNVWGPKMSTKRAIRIEHYVGFTAFLRFQLFECDRSGRFVELRLRF